MDHVRSVDAHLLAKVPVSCACIASITANLLYIHLEQTLMHLASYLLRRDEAYIVMSVKRFYRGLPCLVNVCALQYLHDGYPDL